MPGADTLEHIEIVDSRAEGIGNNLRELLELLRIEILFHHRQQVTRINQPISTLIKHLKRLEKLISVFG